MKRFLMHKKLLSAVLCLGAVCLLTGCGKQESVLSAEAVETAVCTHRFENGVCSSCGKECSHEFEDGVCTVCGKVCAHEFEDGVCRICGMVCSHEFEDGICSVCGEECTHDFQNGVCSICGYVCPHEHHGEDLKCDLCGELCWHHYEGGRCTVCGKAFTPLLKMPEPEWFAPCGHPGTVEEVNFANENGDPRLCKVYLPYGYDPEQQYDTAFLLHGDPGDRGDWIDAVHSHGGRSWRLCDLYDHMIENHICPPVIIISPEYHSWSYATGYEQLARELHTVVLPQIAEKYGTYAEDGSPASLQKARNHFLFGGLSRGAMYAYGSLLPYCGDICSNFVLMSGGTHDGGVCQVVSESPDPLHLLYVTSGENDGAFRAETLYNGLLDSTDALQDGVNCRLEILPGMGHRWDNWTACIFNALQLAF